MKPSPEQLEKAEKILRKWHDEGEVISSKMGYDIAEALALERDNALDEAAQILERKCNSIHLHVICDESARDEIRALKSKEKP